MTHEMIEDPNNSNFLYLVDLMTSVISVDSIIFAKCTATEFS